MSKALHFGVNLNNREPLLVPEYDLSALLALAGQCETLGFDSVWVGDSLLSRPRWEPLSLLSAISQRTETLRLGTACLVPSARQPLWLAAQWATLDRLCGGRTIFGLGVGSSEPSVRREFDALGLPFSQRVSLFEENVRITRQLLTHGRVDFQGRHHQLDAVAFHSGTESMPMLPLQQPPPMLIVSNPYIKGALEPAVMKGRIEKACRRILELGDGWMTCCRARHPQELREQLQHLYGMATAANREPADLTIAYQVTMYLADSREQAVVEMDRYISAYYPELSRELDLAEWGPMGTAEDISEWIDRFAAAGVDTFVCRFGGTDQAAQVERFASEVLPRFVEA